MQNDLYCYIYLVICIAYIFIVEWNKVIADFEMENNNKFRITYFFKHIVIYVSISFQQLSENLTFVSAKICINKTYTRKISTGKYEFIKKASEKKTKEKINK